MTGLAESKGCCIPSSQHIVPSVSNGEQTPGMRPQGLHNLTRAGEGTGSAGSSLSGIGDGMYESGERGQHRMIGDLKVRGSARSTPLLAPGTQWAYLSCLRTSTSQVHKVLLLKDAPAASVQCLCGALLAQAACAIAFRTDRHRACCLQAWLMVSCQSSLELGRHAEYLAWAVPYHVSLLLQCRFCQFWRCRASSPLCQLQEIRSIFCMVSGPWP